MNYALVIKVDDIFPEMVEANGASFSEIVVEQWTCNWILDKEEREEFRV